MWWGFVWRSSHCCIQSERGYCHNHKGNQSLGATVSVFASIAMTGMKLVASAEMDYRNSSIVGLAAALGMGVSQATAALATFPQWVTTIFGKSPVVLATLIAVILNVILPKTRNVEKEEALQEARVQEKIKEDRLKRQKS